MTTARLLELLRRTWRYGKLAALAWVILVAVVPAVAHRDAFPSVGFDSYEEPSAIDCGRWPDADCVERRDAYTYQWTIAQRDDFIEVLASDLDSSDNERAKRLASELLDPSNSLATPSARQCYAEKYLASSYRHAQNTGLVDAFRAFVRLALSVPRLSAVSKIPLTSGKAVSQPSGSISGFNDDRYLSNLEQGVALCG